MTLSCTETERRIVQLDNDVSEIYSMIADVQNTQRRHTHRLSETAPRLEDVEGGLAGVQERLERLEGQVAEMLALLRGRAQSLAVGV
jgi:hypothetical protein